MQSSFQHLSSWWDSFHYSKLKEPEQTVTVLPYSKQVAYLNDT